MPYSTELTTAIEAALTRHQLHVPAVGRQRIVTWAAEAQKHGRRTNLIGMFEPERIAEELVADSLMLLPLLQGFAPSAVVDVGAGAGVPGLILAGALDLPAILIEPRAKRTMFLRHAARAMNLQTPARVFEARLEDLRSEQFASPSPRLWVSRAVFAPEAWVQIAADSAQTGDLIALWCNEHRNARDFVLPEGLEGIREQSYTIAGPGPRSVLLFRVP